MILYGAFKWLLSVRLSETEQDIEKKGAIITVI